MQVVVATTVNPFVQGGATFISDWLVQELRSRGHSVELFNFPFSDDPAELLDQTLGLRLLDMSSSGERLITIRTPSHVLIHPRKRCWFIHHFRSAYDLWGTKYQTIPNSAEGEGLRRAIVAADNKGLREATGVFCNSAVVQRRLKQYNQVDAKVLYPPLIAPENYRAAEYGDYVLYFSRLSHHKRQWLAIESLRHAKTDVKLVIAGAPDPNCGPYVEELHRLVEKYRLQGRVEILPYWVDDLTKQRLFANCRAAAYFPFDEDSYGYPSLEAHWSEKAVLTTLDSGGPLELVVHERNGLVTPPDPELIGKAMDRLYSNEEAARQMGRAGLARIKELGIDWDSVVANLLG